MKAKLYKDMIGGKAICWFLIEIEDNDHYDLR